MRRGRVTTTASTRTRSSRHRHHRCHHIVAILLTMTIIIITMSVHEMTHHTTLLHANKQVNHTCTCIHAGVSWAGAKMAHHDHHHICLRHHVISSSSWITIFIFGILIMFTIKITMSMHHFACYTHLLRANQGLHVLPPYLSIYSGSVSIYLPMHSVSSKLVGCAKGPLPARLPRGSPSPPSSPSSF